MKRTPYVIWAYQRVENACVLDTLVGVERDFELVRGVPQMARFPQDAQYTMDANYPRNLIMPDNLNNIDRYIVASRRLKEFLESRSLIEVEYLQVAIRNHKNKILGDPYYIVHPTHPVDCLEVDKCDAVWGKVAKDKITLVKRLVIDESRIDPARELFRLKLFYEVILIRRDLAAAIDAAGFTGIRWIELENYPPH